MKIITLYECEICGQRYDNEEHAKECEARGKAPEYPIGTIYGSHVEGDMYQNITFAVAKNKLWNHMNDGYSWACRDTGAGDSLGKETCAGNSLHLNEHWGQLDFEHPTFKRMVEWLKSQNIPVFIWDGKKPVLYSGELKEKTNE